MILGTGSSGQRVLPLRHPTTVPRGGSKLHEGLAPHPPPADNRGGPGSASPAGLTLVELLVSVAILAGATVLVMQSLAKGAYALSIARNRIRAYSFANDKLAELEVAFREELDTKSHGQFLLGRDAFRWHLTTALTEIDPTLELVTLQVEWTQGRHPYTTQVSLLRQIPQIQP